MIDDYPAKVQHTAVIAMEIELNTSLNLKNFLPFNFNQNCEMLKSNDIQPGIEIQSRLILYIMGHQGSEPVTNSLRCF